MLYSSNHTTVIDARGHSYNIMGYRLGLGGIGLNQPTVLSFAIVLPGTTIYEFFLQYEVGLWYSI